MGRHHPGSCDHRAQSAWWWRRQLGCIIQIRCGEFHQRKDRKIDVASGKQHEQYNTARTHSCKHFHVWSRGLKNRCTHNVNQVHTAAYRLHICREKAGVEFAPRAAGGGELSVPAPGAERGQSEKSYHMISCKTKRYPVALLCS